jgi:hypothetical protein
VIVSRIPRWKWTGARCFIRVPRPIKSSAANCAAALATLPGLVRPPDGMMAIELEMGSEGRAKTRTLTASSSWSFPSSARFSTPPLPKQTGASKSSLRMLQLAKTGAVQVPSSCPRRVGVSVGGTISAANPALTDATSKRENRQRNTMQEVCFVLCASRNRRPNKEGSCSVDCRALDGFLVKNGYSDLQPESLS